MGRRKKNLLSKRTQHLENYFIKESSPHNSPSTSVALDLPSNTLDIAKEDLGSPNASSTCLDENDYSEQGISNSGQKDIIQNLSVTSKNKDEQRHIQKNKNRFLKEEDSKVRIRKHASEELYKCSDCYFQCSLSSNFIKHKRKHLEVKLFTCEFCSFKSAHYWSLQRHTTLHKSLLDKKCNQCEFKCSSQIKLNNHMVVHSGKQYFSCSFCEYKHRVQSVVKRHMICHTNNRRLRCPYCSFKAVKPDYIEKHLANYHKCEVDNLNCKDKLDKENFDTILHNEKTMYKNNSSIEYKTPVILLSRCDGSNNVPTVDDLQKKDLSEQLQVTNNFSARNSDEELEFLTEEGNISSFGHHNGNNKISSSVSFDPNKFVLVYNYERRNICMSDNSKRTPNGSLPTESVVKTITVKEIVFKRIAPEIKVELHVCDKCSYSSDNLDDFEKHVKIHMKTTPYPCDYCEFFASGHSSLQRHKRLKHSRTKMKPFKCNLCGYRCAINQYLKNHMTTHLKFKRFACNRCDFRTKTKLCLKKHIDRHDGIKPFSCNVCDYRCGSKAYLKVHNFIHTGETKYVCKICDYKAALKTTLQRHMLVHKNN